MELPQYHIPSFKGVLMHMWERGKSFIAKAGTVIFVSCAVIWFLQSFNWSLEMVEAGDSILASIGNIIAPIFAPLGFGNWQSAVATVTGLVAKENVVGTFGVLYGIADAAEDDTALVGNLAAMFTVASGFAFVAFNMLCAPCFAAIGAIKREMGSWKWTWITLGFQTFTAYIVALLINQVGSFLLGSGSLIGALSSIIIAIAVVSIVILTGRSSKEKKINGQLSYTK
jgi:ferrous iron transport protein B